MKRRFGTLVHCYEFGWSLAGLQGPDVQGKDGKKHHSHTVINFIKYQYWEKM
jgi:hypothetical protein